MYFFFCIFHTAVFFLELYKGGSKGRVCVIRNEPTEQVIDESTDESEKELLAVSRFTVFKRLRLANLAEVNNLSVLFLDTITFIICK